MQEQVKAQIPVSIVAPLGYSSPFDEWDDQKLLEAKKLIGGFEFYLHASITSAKTMRLVIYHTKRGLPAADPEMYEGPQKSVHQLRSGKGLLQLICWTNESGEPPWHLMCVITKDPPVF